MKQLQVTKQDSMQRFDKYLKRVFPEMGTSFLYKMLRKKNITLNGKKATGSEQIADGDIIQCFFSDETFDKFSGKTFVENDTDTTDITQEYTHAFVTLKNIGILYEDEHILLLNKPAGVLSQKAKQEDISLNEWMIGYLLDSDTISEDSLKRFKPSVCNRLDRNTSGLVICGKSLIGSREMSRIFKDRSLHKYYRTYVHGKLVGKQVLEGYYYKNTKNNRATVHFHIPERNIDEYDSIITAYSSLIAKDKYSYLEIELITGKTHQIRAHLSAYGHAIVGDKKYANMQNAEDKDYPKYQLLHAYRIVFPTLEGELSYLSDKEFICKEPDSFNHFNLKYFN